MTKVGNRRCNGEAQHVQERGEAWDSTLETQLCYEIKTFLLAGHETSAAMLTWTLYELTQNAGALQKVRRGKYGLQRVAAGSATWGCWQSRSVFEQLECTTTSGAIIHA